MHKDCTPPSHSLYHTLFDQLNHCEKNRLNCRDLGLRALHYKEETGFESMCGLFRIPPSHGLLFFTSSATVPRRTYGKSRCWSGSPTEHPTGSTVGSELLQYTQFLNPFPWYSIAWHSRPYFVPPEIRRRPAKSQLRELPCSRWTARAPAGRAPLVLVTNFWRHATRWTAGPFDPIGARQPGRGPVALCRGCRAPIRSRATNRGGGNANTWLPSSPSTLTTNGLDLPPGAHTGRPSTTRASGRSDRPEVVRPVYSVTVIARPSR